ncbi:biotin/acetyl-CoA-carboxylase ligase [Brachyspira sp. CAG:484]|nr:biotin/acetyl-CoA-carboxylase ligase [Brachyspira sp. CAG:484]
MNTVYLERVESTNLFAKSNLHDLADCTVVHAKEQTAGRGRMQRKWVDLGEGNLFMSFVLKPSNSFNEVYSNLTQYLSVVLCDLLDEFGVSAEIKWPNDVQVNGKKIAGILSETVMQGSEFKGLVLGIGVNLNAEKSAVEAIPDKAVTSLNLETGSYINLDDFRCRLTDSFFAGYKEFLNTGFPMIKEKYVRRACFLNREITVKVFNDDKKGVAKSITEKGELILANNNKEFVLTIGDIL